jgi:tetratricopeptide (TPR) repeat protein
MKWLLNLLNRNTRSIEIDIESMRRKTPFSDLHFQYLEKINYYYKRREVDTNAIDKCIEYCQQDISILPKFRDEYIEEWGNFDIRVPSFRRLAIIYEKQGKYNKAIEVCKLAIKYDLHDGTKGDFPARLTKLRQKIK